MANTGYVDDWGDAAAAPPPSKSAAKAQPAAAPQSGGGFDRTEIAKKLMQAYATGLNPLGIGLTVASKVFGKSPVYRAVENYTKLPAEAITAVLGSGERVVSQEQADVAEHKPGAGRPFMAEAAGGPLLGALGALDPKTRAQMGRDLWAIAHPNDPSIEGRSEAAVNLQAILSKNPGLLGKIQNLAVRTGYQTLKDPTTFLGAGGAALGEHLLGLSDALTRTALVSRKPVVAKAAEWLTANTPEKTEAAKAAIVRANTAGQNVTKPLGRFRAVAQDAATSRQSIAAINAARNKGLAATRKLGSSDSNLIAKHRKELQQIDELTKTQQPGGLHTENFQWPAEIEERLKLGPTSEQQVIRNPQTGMGLEYEPPIVPTGDKAALFKRNDAESIIRSRLEESREQIRRHTVYEQLHHNLKDLSHQQLEEIANVDPRKTGPSALHSMAQAQTDAMLTTGAPHMRNVGVAGFLALGERGMARVGQFMLTGVPQALKDRIEEGAASHFGFGEGGKIIRAFERVPGFRQWRGFTSGALDKWDEAIRAARLEQVDREMPEAQEYEKLDRVNQDIGAYGVKPKWTEYAPAFGANFPQWHGYIVPTMFARALLRNPGRVGRFGRYEQNFNDTMFPDQRYRWTFGGPVDEGASAAADAARLALGKYPSYFGGQSTAGAFGETLRPSFSPLAERAADYVGGFLPFGNVAAEMLFNRYREIPTAAEGAATSMGFYPQARTPGSFERTSGYKAPLAPLPIPANTTAAAKKTAAAAPAKLQGGYVDDWGSP